MEDNQEEKKSNRGFLYAIIAVLLLINGIAGYLLFNENKAKKDLQVQKVEVDNQYKTVVDELDKEKASLDEYKGKNAELDSIITARQAEIDKYKGQIETLLTQGKMSASKLAEARGLIAKLQTENKEFAAKIEKLTSENKELFTQNKKLDEDLSKEKESTSKLSDEKVQLSKKVELGSLFSPGNITVEGIHTKGSGKEVETTHLKRLDKIKICFETGVNKVLEKGTMSIYVRIINPHGETIAVQDQGSGTLKMAEGGTDVQYTKKADFQYDGLSKKVCIDWSQAIKDAGDYKVELYQSGYLIGKGSVKLK